MRHFHHRRRDLEEGMDEGKKELDIYVGGFCVARDRCLFCFMFL